MIGTSERRSAEFLAWERNGRGYRVWPQPVALEPTCAALPRRNPINAIDDGRKSTALADLMRIVSEWLAPTELSGEPAPEVDDDIPAAGVRGQLIELQAYLPHGVHFDREAYLGLFASLSMCLEPVAFEVVATCDRIAVQFAVCLADESLVRSQLRAFLPDVTFNSVPAYLRSVWDEAGGAAAVVDFGPGKEFLVPFSTPRRDPFVGLAGALNELREGETAVYQVIFCPARGRWREAILRSVTHGDGSVLFVNAPELLPAAKEKTSHLLTAAIIRLGVRAEEAGRAWEIACDVAGTLGVYGSASGNELVPLDNGEYPQAQHEYDLLARQTRRSGMILNAAELAGFVHIPSDEVRADRLRKQVPRSKAAPAAVTGHAGLRLGTNSHAGWVGPVTLTEAQRAAHIYVVGASGTGKSTLLYNLAMQGIERGEGLSIIDPHGELVDRVLGSIPDDRLDDVVLLDPGDVESVVAFNVLAAQSASEKSLLASDLVAVFRRLSDAWGHQLNSVLSNALLAFMDSDRDGTLFDVRRFLLEPAFRSEFLKSVRDPEVSYYWRHAFPQLAGNKSVGPVVTRLDAFLAPKAIRAMVGMRENRIDFRDIMDSGRIFLAKLSQGSIGRENARLLGGLLVAKIQAEAMSRQRTGESDRRFHSLILDEFHDVLTPSLAECIAGVRKYRLGLVLAHQERRQLARESEVESAVLNAHTRIVFRVNETDARALASGFSGFDERDLLNLSNYQAVCRVERADWDFNLALDAPRSLDASAARERREKVVAASRAKYGTPRTEAERQLRADVTVAAEAELLNPPAAAQPAKSVQISRREPQSVADFSQPPSSKSSSVTAPPTDLGKGGAQHKAIQDRIKEEAEKLGFRVSIEQNFPGLGQIDLVLVRDGVSVACEVNVEGTIDYEVGNVSKCHKAGFSLIAVVGTSEDKLAKLSAAVANSLGAEKAKCVSYSLPDAFITWLSAAPVPEVPPAATTRTRGGRVVKRAVASLSAEEAKAKEEGALKLMAELMKKARKAVGGS